MAGKWRIIYEIYEDQKLVVLRSIGHRKRIYTDFP
ncbi:type II toxin-antitoxin system RelE family toxin [Archaeoglobus sp.]